MIKTAIILALDGNFPIWHKNDGFAKTKSVARWIFDFCGFKTDKSYPDLCTQESVVEWEEGDAYFPSNPNELFILGSRLVLN